MSLLSSKYNREIENRMLIIWVLKLRPKTIYIINVLYDHRLLVYIFQPMKSTACFYHLKWGFIRVFHQVLQNEIHSDARYGDFYVRMQFSKHLDSCCPWAIVNISRVTAIWGGLILIINSLHLSNNWIIKWVEVIQEAYYFLNNVGLSDYI